MPKAPAQNPQPSLWKGILVETCLESGSLTEKQIKEALRGTKHRVEMQAVVSLIEHFIGEANHDARAATDTRTRDEACGASSYLFDLRARIMEFTQKETEEEEDAETRRPGD